jgi:ABC-type transporter lipoprotein component MlaA
VPLKNSAKSGLSVFWRVLAVVAMSCVAFRVHSQTVTNSPSADEMIVLPEPIGDPLEPMNRGLWKLNQFVLRTAIQPSAKVYRVVVPSDVRRGIRNAGRNLSYPRNVVNNLLQKKWSGARDETYRFLLNSTAGIGGLFDVASPAGIYASEADFGQTFRDWGWDPKIYLMLPISGPSNERDAVGGFTDRMVNPLTYYSPWSYLTLGFMYNNLTETVDEYIRAAEADSDPYTVLRYAWTINRDSRPTDITPATEHDVSSLDTLQTVFFRLRNARFPERGELRRVLIGTTAEELPYNLWLQPRPAPLVYLTPGIGSHRLSGGAVALAELLHDSGFSVITVSSPYNYEFMRRAASTPLPGYTPVDAEDLHEALTVIDRDVRGDFPERFTSRALLGYSMGGFHSLYITATSSNNSERLQFDRVVAIDAPVRLDSAIAKLDEHYRAALNWPAAERTERIDQTFHEIAALSQRLNTITPDSPIPIDANESRFLVGLAFRLTLRDIIFVSQVRTNMGILQKPVLGSRREPVYREIMQYSFGEYLEKFVTPYYATRNVDLNDQGEFARAVDLREHAAALKANPDIRVISNANDLLLGKEDVEWLQKTFEKRLMLFERGGHLGNLGETIVQQQIVRALADLLPPHTRY